MKELSIEEKAKAYDKAINTTRNLVKAGLIYEDAAIQVFPELLKESEDERIRKAIKYGLDHVFTNNTTIFEVTKEQCLAWLEKQGEHANFRNKIQVGDKVTRNKDGVLVNLSQLNRIAKKDEKQGENNKWKPSKDEMDALYGLAYITNRMDDKKDEAITKLYQDLKREFFNGASYENMFPSNPVDSDINIKKQGEQKPEGKTALEAAKEEKVDNQNCVKPADKVEPKFKVEKDKWYVCISQYCNCIEGRNYKASLDGRIIDDYGTEYDMHDDAYKYFRLWTIQDAKDGDVLVKDIYPHGMSICLFKEFTKPFTMELYCSINNRGQFLPYNSAYYHRYEVILRPATKEQRDLLFQKMKEAGYEWDADNKELKKIEKKPANNIEPIFNVGDKIQYLKGCGTIMTIEKIENGEYIFANNMGHTTIKDGNKWYLIEQKPAWSEKDARLLDNCISLIEDIDCTKEEQNWLKALKYRVQPSQEWSEEDENVLEDIEEAIINYWHGDTQDILLDWLKSLRPQNRWKPSDEQMAQLQKYCPDNRLLTSLYEQLRKVREE